MKLRSLVSAIMLALALTAAVTAGAAAQTNFAVAPIFAGTSTTCGATNPSQPTIGAAVFRRADNAIGVIYDLRRAQPSTQYRLELWTLDPFCQMIATFGLVTTNSNGSARAVSPFNLTVLPSQKHFFASIRSLSGSEDSSVWRCQLAQ